MNKLTLDEAIKHCLEVAEQNETDAITYKNCKEIKTNMYEKLLAEKVENDCRECAAEHRQLAEWLKELKEAKRLLKAAVEDMTGMQFGEECKVCSKKLLPNECPIHNNVSCILEKDFKWRYAEEALALIGGENDERPSENKG